MSKTLDDIFEDDDDFGLLNSKEKAALPKTDEDRLIDSFEEVNTFFERYEREPSSTSMSEYNLMARLRSFRNDDTKKKTLKPFDKFNLLGYVELDKKTFEDIVEEDELGLLDTDSDSSIFLFKHTPKPQQRTDSDFTAQREPVPEEEFKKYEALFQQVHKELKTGERRFRKFDRLEKNLQPGNFYMLDGILLYLESADLKSELRGKVTGGRVQLDGRTVTIFENGTRSKMRYRSLGKSIQEDGKLITKPYESFSTEIKEIESQVSEEDVQSGWVYILKSKATNPALSKIQNLYKIGFSTTPVSGRLKNAANEATYLFAEVEIVDSYRCYNLNTQHFEGLIHRFFGECCLNIDVYDKSGNRFMPREWFVVPLKIIQQAVSYIVSGEIVNYKYDKNHEKIMLRD